MESSKQLVFLGLLLLITFIDFCSAGATMDQMNQAGKMMRDVCQPKFKLSDEVANKVKDGTFPDDKKVKCYVNCVMEMMQAIKKGKVLYESSLKQIDILLPDELKPQYRAGFEACKNSVDGVKDHCEAAYTLLKCLYGKIDLFVFP